MKTIFIWIRSYLPALQATSRSAVRAASLKKSVVINSAIPFSGAIVKLILLYECTVLYPRFCWMDTGKFTGVKNLESASQM
ncbi:hypothetical protein D9597_14515 [Escherichia sp. E13S3]|nr:hypothetical protein D9597_14515 [Escherichia sp. E13S3]